MVELERIGGTRVEVGEASGLTWDPFREVLITVGDDSGRAFEIMLADPPKVTRELELEQGDQHDLEGIAMTRDGRCLLIASEKKRRILVYDREGELLEQVPLEIDWKHKKSGVEGVAVDLASGRTFAVHERDPTLLLELDASYAITSEVELDVF